MTAEKAIELLSSGATIPTALITRVWDNAERDECTDRILHTRLTGV